MHQLTAHIEEAAAEVAAQFAQLPDKYGSTLGQAQQTLLAYQEHESSAFQLFKSSDGKLIPSYTAWDNTTNGRDTATLDIFSLTYYQFVGGGTSGGG